MVRLLLPQWTHTTSQTTRLVRPHSSNIASQEQLFKALCRPDGHTHTSASAVVLHFAACTTVLFNASILGNILSLSISMPTYHARSITVRLGSMPLAETTTSEIVLRKGEAAKRQSEAAEKELLHSFLLDEKRMLFPGDSDGYDLNWLGNAPFMQVQADAGFAQSPGRPGSLRQPGTLEKNCPQALAVHIKLSDKTFISGFTDKTHLKIEVLFNGQLSACSLIHTNDIRSGAKSLHQVFAGYRVDFLAERPWVLLPPYTAADGGKRRFRKTIAPSDRWEQIGAALLKEAKERGTNKNRESPPSATFLRELAEMQKPESVKDLQKPGGRKFGVVDVVITAGVGSKLTAGTNYLKSPQRLRDSDYIVRTERKTKDKIGTAGSDQTMVTTDTLSQVENKDPIDTYADPEEDRERPYKRIALSPVAILSQPTLLDSDCESIPSGARIPHLPPTRPSIPQSNLCPTSGRISLRCPSPERRSDGHKEPLPLADRYRTFQLSIAQHRSDDASCASPVCHSPPTELRASRSNAPSLRPHPVDVPFCEPWASHEVLSGLPLATSASSSRMARTFSLHSSDIGHPTLPSGIDTQVSVTVPGPSTPYVAPTATMHPPGTDWKRLPSAMSSPYYGMTHLLQHSPPGFYTPGLVPHMPPNGLPYLFPQTSPSCGFSGPAPYKTPTTSSSPMFTSCGPLPPTAMFTVTSKPRRSVSPKKGIATEDTNRFRSEVLMSRLVITGLDGTVIVDHRWRVAQRITVSHGRSDEGLVESRTKFPDSNDHEPKVRSSVRSQSLYRYTTSQTRSQAASPLKLQPGLAEQSMREHRQDSIQDGRLNQTHEFSLPYLKKHQCPAKIRLPNNPRVEIVDNVAGFRPATKLTNDTAALTPATMYEAALSTQEIASQHRAYFRNGLPGVQDPKAATFLLDDPEEILREAARMRRSRSPTKPAVTPSVPSTTSLAQVNSTAQQKCSGGSSPLSSVPSSPIPEGLSRVVNILNAGSGSISQLDGSLERTHLATSPHGLRTPSPTKSSFLTPKYPRPGLATPLPSISPESKKRRAPPRPSIKSSRSHDRLKTVVNPPLNNDCVIAFAESKNEDKDNERGVLRQVKGERQGIFKEEHVVLAVRFFIAGD